LEAGEAWAAGFIAISPLLGPVDVAGPFGITA
jgi:hypothetical protein